MTEDDIKSIVEFGAYRGVIERTRISDTRFVELDESGSRVQIVGRRHANRIVRALNDAGYSIVRTSELSNGEER